ncbi:hypothetical protein ACGIF2_04525 [Cellulomonas sp. P22]|uniref:hypothetical protein n=1 Tax=Cellulomonas sp. P22 TaxID=3373189 RepID=UPI0037903673
MLVAAALVPETALLVPGAAGRADVLDDVRAAALEAVRSVVDARPDQLVVVAPGPVDRVLGEHVRASLAPAGIPDGQLGWQPPVPAVPGDFPAGIGASVGMLLTGAAGWTGRTLVAEVAEPEGAGPEPLEGAGDAADTGGPSARTRAERLQHFGATLAAAADASVRVGLVVAGSLSARHGPDGPLADDPRAELFDSELLADLADGGPAARARMARSSSDEASSLAVSGWGPWQVLVGAVGGPPADRQVQAAVLTAQAPLGAQYVVATWTPDVEVGA